MQPLLRIGVNGVKSWLDVALSFFYPEVCQYCGHEPASAAEGYIGAKCREKVNFIAPPYCERCGLPFEGDITTSFVCSWCRETTAYFSYARAAVVFNGVILEVLHRYKYQRALWFEPFLADLLVQQAAPVLRRESWDMIVPVPLHPLKESEREFNQAERLARQLSKATQIPMQKRLLVRLQPTRSQTQLSRDERAENVKGAFALRQPEVFKDKRLVLVDDVRTTGATTNACARVLREAGAQEVCVWTLARGLLK